MTDDPIKSHREGGILQVTLDRPKANAIDAATSRIMSDVFKDFRDDDSLRVAIVTGGGEKFFCAGWDLKAAASGEEGTEDFGEGGFGGMQELRDLNKPIVVAINGICCGGGLEVAISGDILIASEKASFALPEIRSGTIADAASIKLPKRIPYHIAMEMLLTGRWLAPEEAHRWGLINEVVAADKLMSRAWEVARLLETGPPLVYAAIKEVVRDAENKNFQDALNKLNDEQYPTIATLYNSEDRLEGAKAFAEKRDPVWKGR